MKRILCMLLALGLLVSLAACQGKEPPQQTESSPVTQTTAPTEAPTQTTAPMETTAPIETTAAPTETTAPTEEITPLALEKSLYTYFEWAEGYDPALVRSEHSFVTLSQEAAQQYPDLAQQLRQIATMQENTMLDEFDNLVSLAKEDLSANRGSFETYVSTVDVQVRRADSLVLSLLCESYSHYAHIRNSRFYHGSNYDPQTGKALALNEVVDVNNDLALAVQAELLGHLWTGEFYSETTVEDYFANTPYDSFNWTLDSNGLTFYFAPGELCEEGHMTATVTFAQHPELFRPKYLVQPEQYTAEMPMHLSFFAQLDADDPLEVLSFSAYREPERDHYASFTVSTESSTYTEDCFVYDLHPYFVKTAGGSYLYLFREDFDAGMRQMSLTVLRLHADGSITKTGDYTLSPAWLADNRFTVPTDPESLSLDDWETGLTMGQYAPDADGAPFLQ